MGKNWYIYLVKCSDGSFYTGITNDVSKRMKSHASGKGSKYIRSRGFEKVLFIKECESRSEALKKEYFVKQLKQEQKIKWFLNHEKKFEAT